MDIIPCCVPFCLLVSLRVVSAQMVHQEGLLLNPVTPIVLIPTVTPSQILWFTENFLLNPRGWWLCLRVLSLKLCLLLHQLPQLNGKNTYGHTGTFLHHSREQQFFSHTVRWGNSLLSRDVDLLNPMGSCCSDSLQTEVQTLKTTLITERALFSPHKHNLASPSDVWLSATCQHCKCATETSRNVCADRWLNHIFFS